MSQKMFADSLVQGERVGSGRDADPADDDPDLDPDSCYFFFRYKSKCKGDIDALLQRWAINI